MKEVVERSPEKTLLGGESIWRFRGLRRLSQRSICTSGPCIWRARVREGHLFHREFGWDGGDPEMLHPKDVSISWDD